MIDLTPLDVRKKRGDFRKLMRGYDPSEVDTFLDLVAERLEELVKENLTLRERSDRLQEQVTQLSGRENAVQDALVTAQELRSEIRAQAQREADLLRREAEAEGRRLLAEADQEAEARRSSLVSLERRRQRFLGAFRQLLERELDTLAVEEGRTPTEEVPVDMDLRGGRRRRSAAAEPPAREAAATEAAAGDEAEREPATPEPGAPVPAGSGPNEGTEPPPRDAPVHSLAEEAGVYLEDDEGER
jgi:cell division initiation protein